MSLHLTNTPKSSYKQIQFLALRPRHLLEFKRSKEDTRAFIELRLELDPVQPEGVQEGRQSLHKTQDADGQHGPEGEDDVDSENERHFFASRCYYNICLVLVGTTYTEHTRSGN